MAMAYWGLLGLFGLLVIAALIPAVSHRVGVLGAKTLVPALPLRGGWYGQLSRIFALTPAIVILLLLLAMLGVAMGRSRLMRPKDRPCEACGGIITAKHEAGRVLCFICIAQQQGAEELKKNQVRATRFFVVGLGVFGTVFTLAVGGLARSLLVPGFGSIPLFAVVAIWCLGLAWLSLKVLVLTRRFRWLIDEGAALAKARECAGEEGAIVKDGPTTIWYSGPADPGPMLREQSAPSRGRFAAILGETDLAEPTLRVFCFHDRGAFDRFHQQPMRGVDVGSKDGIYFYRPAALFTLCTLRPPAG